MLTQASTLLPIELQTSLGHCGNTTQIPGETTKERNAHEARVIGGRILMPDACTTLDWKKTC